MGTGKEQERKIVVACCNFTKTDVENALMRIQLNSMDTGATATSTMIPTPNGLQKVMTASSRLVFGLQCFPGKFSYISEIMTNFRRAVNVSPRMSVDDLATMARPGPRDFFNETEDEDSVIGLVEPACGR